MTGIGSLEMEGDTAVHIRQFVEFWPTYLMWSSGRPSEAFSAVICSFAATYKVVISSSKCQRAAAHT